MKDPQPTMHPIWRLVHSGGGGALFLALWLVACDAFQDPSSPSLTIYTSQDQVYAEPIFKAFEETSGIRVKALYDHESVKSMGLAKRLVAEKGHPVCDLFWSNESLTMRQLLEKGVIHSLESFGYRSRVMIINTRAIAPDKAPATLLEWTEPQWRNRCVMAYPLFGTTATHMLALRQKWGDEAWSHWCQKLADNGLRTVDGNSAVVQMVGRGDAWIGLTDSDDLAVGLRQGLPLVSMPLNQELCPIVNSVGWVQGRDHGALVDSFVSFLKAPTTLQAMVEQSALVSQGPPQEDAPWLKPTWEPLLKDASTGLDQMKRFFMP